MNNVVKVPIGELVSIRRGASPRPIDDWISEEGIPWVKISDATSSSGRFIKETQQFIKEDGKRHSVEVFPEDLIISNSATPALPKVMKIHACVHDGWLVASDYKGITRDYLFYCIKYFRKSLLNQGNGSIYKNLKTDILKEFEIPVPIDENGNYDIEAQNRITEILTTIEDKIEVNQLIMEEMENTIKDIYEYWFLQSEFPNEEGKPYKSSGGEMVWNEALNKEIPVSWTGVEFQEICNIRRGASPRPIDDYMDETHTGMPWVKISDATACDSPFLTSIKEHIVKEGISKSVHISPETLIVSNSATPGIPKYIQIDACVHDGWLVLDGYESNFTYYLYFVIKMIRNNLINVASGSIFKNLKTDYLKKYVCIKPTNAVLDKFQTDVEPMMKKILEAQRESEELESIKEFLLPMLMAGRI